MKIEKIINELPGLCKDRKIAIHVGIVAVCTLIALMGLFQLHQSYQLAQENTQQITNMKTIIDKYNKLNEKMNAEEYRPVDKEELDAIQTDILTNIQRNNLTLSDFSGKADKKATNYQKYVLKVQGQWNNVMNFINNFRSTTALISINRVDLKQEKNNDKDDNRAVLIECELTYKVYTK